MTKDGKDEDVQIITRYLLNVGRKMQSFCLSLLLPCWRGRKDVVSGARVILGRSTEGRCLLVSTLSQCTSCIPSCLLEEQDILICLEKARVIYGLIVARVACFRFKSSKFCNAYGLSRTCQSGVSCSAIREHWQIFLLFFYAEI